MYYSNIDTGETFRMHLEFLNLSSFVYLLANGIKTMVVGVIESLHSH